MPPRIRRDHAEIGCNLRNLSAIGDDPCPPDLLRVDRSRARGRYKNRLGTEQSREHTRVPPTDRPKSQDERAHGLGVVTEGDVKLCRFLEIRLQSTLT